MRNVLITICLVFLTNGCSPEQFNEYQVQRQEMHEARIEALKKDRLALANLGSPEERSNCKLTLGMNQKEVREKWGEPINITEQISIDGPVIIWTYGELKDRYANVYIQPDHFLHFLDGTLTEIIKL